MPADVIDIALRMTTRSVSAALKDVELQLRRVGRQADRTEKEINDIGKAGSRAGGAFSGLRRGLGGVAAALGGGALFTGAIQGAINFEEALSRVTGLTSLTAEEVQRATPVLKKIGRETGVTLAEIADGFFFAASAGNGLTQSLEIVRGAARGTAAGMGNLRELVRATNSALNVYADTGLTAADAFDILTQTVKVGVIDVRDFATTIGRAIGTAGEVGVAFEDLAAFIAQASLQGFKSQESVTRLVQILKLLVSPTEAVQKAFREARIDLEAFQESAKGGDGALFFALQNLDAQLKRSGLSLTDLKLDTEALQGALTVAGQAADSASRIVEEMGNRAGAANNAFDAWKATTAGDLKPALARLRQDMITLGTSVLPVVVGAVQTLNTALDATADLANLALGSTIFGLEDLDDRRAQELEMQQKFIDEYEEKFLQAQAAFQNTVRFSPDDVDKIEEARKEYIRLRVILDEARGRYEDLAIARRKAFLGPEEEEEEEKIDTLATAGPSRIDLERAQTQATNAGEKLLGTLQKQIVSRKKISELQKANARIENLQLDRFNAKLADQIRAEARLIDGREERIQQALELKRLEERGEDVIKNLEVEVALAKALNDEQKLKVELTMGEFSEFLPAQREKIRLLKEELMQINKAKEAEEERKRDRKEAAGIRRETMDPATRALEEFQEKLDRINELDKSGAFISPDDAQTARDFFRAEYDKMIEDIKAKNEEMSEEAKKFWGAMEGFAEDNFFNIMQGNFDDLGKGFKTMIDRMVADMLASQLFGQGGIISGAFGGGAGGGAGGTASSGGILASLASAFLADGGRARRGTPYVVGEEGPELFVPANSGTVVPNDALASGPTNVTVNVNATDAQSFIRSKSQVGNAAAQALKLAERRNG